MKSSKTLELIIQILCISLALLILFPIFYAVSVSFMEHREVLSKTPHLLPKNPTTGNYVTAFTRTTLGRYMLNSFLIAAVTSFFRLLFAAMAAYSFAFFEFRGKKILFALAMTTLMIPPDVLIVSNYATISKLGLINTYTGICSIFLVSAANLFLVRQYFLSFASSIRDAAQIDGCGSFRFFTEILLPISKPILVTVFISSFVNVWNQYLWPLLVTNRNEMRTIQVGITMLKDRESSIFGPVMAGVTIALIPTVLVFIVFQRKIVSGMMSGAVKE
ncbi:carbohydrate ABC transporter permease [Clostridiales bacterium COT073_COT-073]|nr:carbohydrate ABC transporter permease [Clostridiales bacterium COT073_COT-073]